MLFQVAPNTAPSIPQRASTDSYNSFAVFAFLPLLSFKLQICWW